MRREARKEEVNFKRFVKIVLPLGFIGWILEGSDHHSHCPIYLPDQA